MKQEAWESALNNEKQKRQNYNPTNDKKAHDLPTWKHTMILIQINSFDFPDIPTKLTDHFFDTFNKLGS